MTNKPGSSPQEFQPSETIKETTVALCQNSVKFPHRRLGWFTECLQVEMPFLLISNIIRCEHWKRRKEKRKKPYYRLKYFSMMYTV